MKRISLLTITVLTLSLAAPVSAQGGERPGKRRHEGGRAFKRMDKNSDRQITREEGARKPEIFDRIDQDKDGILTVEELRAARPP